MDFNVVITPNYKFVQYASSYVAIDCLIQYKPTAERTKQFVDILYKYLDISKEYDYYTETYVLDIYDLPHIPEYIKDALETYTNISELDKKLLNQLVEGCNQFLEKLKEDMPGVYKKITKHLEN